MSYGVQGILEARVMPLGGDVKNGELIPWRGFGTFYSRGNFKAQLELSGTDVNTNSISVGIRVVHEKMIFQSNKPTIPSLSIESSTGIRVGAHRPWWFVGLMGVGY